MVHVNTLTSVLKRAGWCGRGRATVFKKRDKSAFEKAKAYIVELRKRAEAGEITLAYLDEAGFEQTPPNRSAWTPVGEQHCIEAGRGSRLNVVVSDLKTKQGFAKYDKGMDGVFALLESKLPAALKHAKTLAANPADNSEHPNPSTRMHELITRLQAVAASKRK